MKGLLGLGSGRVFGRRPRVLEQGHCGLVGLERAETALWTFLGNVESFIGKSDGSWVGRKD